MRKLSFVMLTIIAFVFLSSDESLAAMKQGKDKDKFTGSTLTGCSLYQLGSDEFVLQLNGKNLPSPVPEFGDDSMSIILENARAVKPEVMNVSVMSFVETTPLLYSFEVENISDDKVAITIKANAALELTSSTRSVVGYNLRIKALEQHEDIAYNPEMFESEQPSVIYPENTLPFAIDTRITVELRDAELRDVLRLLMAEVGRNIIIDTSFPADVLITMSLFDVRIDEVLNHLMRTYDIACYDSGYNTTTFGTREGLYKLSGGRSVKSFKISYADMAQIKNMLRNLASVQEDDIVTDNRMRTIYVNTNPAKMAEVEALLAKIDVPARQVMIRASIFEFNETATHQVETALNVAYDEWQLDLGNGIRADYGEDRTRIGTRSDYYRTTRSLHAALSALEAQDKGKVVANPSVIAIDGQQATIELTQTYTYSVVRDEAGNAISQQEEVGPTLTFTPRIERDDTVYLELELSTGDAIASTGGTPITTDRSVTTRVRVRDGMPFVVGGLFQESSGSTRTKIPILGDIPLLGQLFSSKSNNRARTQTVMVVTPYILN